jgi:predicted TIM-barrel fold metal-dependent hydrolase
MMAADGRVDGRGHGRTVALEEHFRLPEAVGATGAAAGLQARLDVQLADMGEVRLGEMDAAGIDVQVISHAQPAAQQLDPDEAVVRARQINDRLAEAVAAHPDRFAGFASLPTSDPTAAAAELERAVGEHGFVGALIHNTLGTNGVFLDDERFEPILERAERLDVPIYLHPSQPRDDLRAILYADLPGDLARLLATTGWGWHAETGLATLRLVLAGVFDRHPGLRLIIGHCGEMLPFMLARIDQVFAHHSFGPASPPSKYFFNNIWITTSGLLSQPPVLCAIAVFGIERVLFSVDYPYSSNASGRELLDNLPLKPTDRDRLAGDNAERLLKLKPI